jgi:phospholipid/cholesterol/gamma-HCH transport system permease protein
MQVNEEVDALNTFGISPIEFLVLPRVLGLTLMMPFLAMYANLMGVLGGFLVVVLGMGISPAAFVANVQFMASMHQLWIGLFHAFVFGFVVSFAGCYQGLICGRSAEAVGKATTSAVVNAIVGIIVVTSIITIVLSFNGM